MDKEGFKDKLKPLTHVISLSVRLKLRQYKSKENRSELSVPLEKSTSVLALVLCVREHQRVRKHQEL
ncbi:hypothetical protein Bca52824_076979 [Brassica carinata]|uniref:Uncharacterized protein n=1 Tax=Brassica carinata TaxID=52824 RepID=A0A8X7TWU8_BRACI|nr:hypothetical protein Bca52824_076979 [Brassica carinata]